MKPRTHFTAAYRQRTSYAVNPHLLPACDYTPTVRGWLAEGIAQWEKDAGSGYGVSAFAARLSSLAMLRRRPGSVSFSSAAARAVRICASTR